MSNGGIWVTTEGGEVVYYPYDELEDEVRAQLLKPIGGFCYEAQDFIQLPLSAAPFVVESWLPRQGKMLFYGQAKVGKSILALQLARSIGSGEEFLHLPTAQAKVLYLQFELSERELQWRMQQTGQVYENVWVGTNFHMKLDAELGVEELCRALDATKPDVLILDPFYKILSGDENRSQDVLIVLDLLDRLIQSSRLAVVIFHHGGKDLRRMSRGTTTLLDWPDSAVELATVARGLKVTPKLMRHASREVNPTVCEWHNFEWLPIGILTVSERVLDALSAAPASIKDLVTAGVGSRRAIYRAISDLGTKLTKSPDGIYTLQGGN